MAVSYVKFYRGSQVAYDKITEKSGDTLYFITDSSSSRGSLYLGDKLIAGDIDTIQELQDVIIKNVSNGSLLVYNSDTEKWENKTVTEAIGIMTGPVGNQQGSAGLVPAPGVGQSTLFLRGDGTWAAPEFIIDDSVKESLVYEVTCDDFSYDTHVSALNEAAKNDTLLKGSIGVVKVLIATDKYQYVAYVFNGSNWAAMDGNYSVDSIYFDENLIVTSPIGTITQEMINEGSGSVELESKDKSVASVLASLLAEEKDPTVDYPTATLSVPSNGSGEVGTTFTLPTATFKVTDIGSYTYGAKDPAENKYEPAQTGVKFLTNDASITQGGNTTKNTADLVTDSTFTMTASGSNTYADSSISFSFTANATYTGDASVVPVTNLGNRREELRIATAAIDPITKTVSYSGYRNAFGGSNTTAVALNSANIRKLAKSAKSSSSSMSVPITEGATQVILAVPENRVVTKVQDEGAFGTDIFSEFSLTTGIAVEGANGYTSKNYNVYVYTPSTALGANTYTVHMANKA